MYKFNYEITLDTQFLSDKPLNISESLQVSIISDTLYILVNQNIIYTLLFTKITNILNMFYYIS